MDAQTARTTNVRQLVAEAGGPAAFSARHPRWPAPQVSQWISVTNPKGIGHKLARALEEACGRKAGWLDKDHVNYSGGSTENNSYTGTPSQPVTFAPEIVAVAWDWVRFEEGPIDSKGRQPYAYPSDLDRAKRLLELCALIHAAGGKLSASQNEALIDAARTRQQQGKAKDGKRGRASTG